MSKVKVTGSITLHNDTSLIVSNYRPLLRIVYVVSWTIITRRHS